MCCNGKSTYEPEGWETEIEKGLKHNPRLDATFVRGLLETDGDEDDANGMTSESKDTNVVTNSSVLAVPLPLYGYPQRPLLREIARRLMLCSRHLEHVQQRQTFGRQSSVGGSRLLLPASFFGFAEDYTMRLSDCPRSRQDVRQWTLERTERELSYVLGLRITTGTDNRNLLLPSRGQLMKAANRPYSLSDPLLSVAARALAKHAHRSNDGFFETGNGNSSAKTVAATTVLQKLLEDASWINIHTFGGMEGTPVLEVRIGSGHGARWTGVWEVPEANRLPTKVTFRGFLEPQMDDGHDKKWRH